MPALYSLLITHKSSSEDGVELLVQPLNAHGAEVPVGVNDGLSLHLCPGLAREPDVGFLRLVPDDRRNGEHHSAPNIE